MENYVLKGGKVTFNRTSMESKPGQSFDAAIAREAF